MAFTLNGNPLAVDVAFKTSDGTQYPANWLRLSTAKEKTDLGIAEVADAPIYDSRFYNNDGSAKALDGVKSGLKAQEKETAGSLLAKYDWYVVRKAEKSTASGFPFNVKAIILLYYLALAYLKGADANAKYMYVSPFDPFIPL